MKKLLFIFLMSYLSFVKADAMMTSNMLLTSTVLMSGAVETDEYPTDNADFYINQHRVVENTSIDVRNINTLLLKTKNIQEDFSKDNLSVLYSFNHKPFILLNKDSLTSFKEPFAYVTVEKIEYKDKKATVYITVLDKAGHDKAKDQHQSLLYVFLGVAAIFFLILALFMISLG